MEEWCNVGPGTTSIFCCCERELQLTVKARSRVSPGHHALFFCLLRSYQVICSCNGLSTGFGKPGGEKLEISTWGEALDSIWDWAGHCHFDFCLSPFKQQDLYLLFLTALLKSSSEGRNNALTCYMRLDGSAAVSEASPAL